MVIFLGIADSVCLLKGLSCTSILTDAPNKFSHHPKVLSHHMCLQIRSLNKSIYAMVTFYDLQTLCLERPVLQPLMQNMNAELFGNAL